jgi:hypothetical protein
MKLYVVLGLLSQKEKNIVHSLYGILELVTARKPIVHFARTRIAGLNSARYNHSRMASDSISKHGARASVFSIGGVFRYVLLTCLFTAAGLMQVGSSVAIPEPCGHTPLLAWLQRRSSVC